MMLGVAEAKMRREMGSALKPAPRSPVGRAEHHFRQTKKAHLQQRAALCHHPVTATCVHKPP